MSVKWNEYYQKVAQQPHRPNVERAANCWGFIQGRDFAV